jgi:branched-chain amino acid transport system ATP-binding protein
VSVRFEGLTAIDGVTENLNRGEILGLIGPNGAGKTTLVNVLTGFQVPSDGRVSLDGNEICRLEPYRIRQLGIARTFQAGRLFKDMTVSENIEVAGVSLGLSRLEALRRATELLEWMNLSESANRSAGTVPYTDERRIGIARALVKEPKFLLLDEPAAGMSDVEAEALVNLIADIRTEWGIGIVLIEHNMRVVMRVCDRLHVLDSGRTIAAGTPGEVQTNATVISAYLGEE